MESPVIRPGNSRIRLPHRRRKISPIYKWMGLTRHGRVRRKEIRGLRVGLSVGLILSVVFGLYLWSLSKPSSKQEPSTLPGGKPRPVRPLR